MTISDDLRNKIKPYFFVILAFVFMLGGSWRRWTSMIVDIGRETDMPLRIMNGEVLYRDVHFLYPPFGPYFNALLYQAFGVSLDTLVFAGIASSAVLTFLSYRIARRIMPPFSASIAVSFVVVLCFFKPAGNLILSYSFSGLYGAVFAFSAVLFAMRFAETRRRRELLIAGVFIGFAVISKQEFGFASSVATAAYLLFLHRLNIKRLVADIGIAAIPAIAISGSIFAILFATIGARTLIEDCHLFYTHLPESLIQYNSFRSGLDHPVASFLEMIGAAALTTAFVSLIIFASDKRGALRSRLVPLFAVSSVITAVILYIFFEDWDGSPLRALPFLLLGSIAFEWWRRSGSQADTDVEPGGTSPRHFGFIIAVYSICILIRVVLRVPSGGFSGSFYLPTALIFVFYWLLELMPEKLREWTSDQASADRARRITAALCIVTTAVMAGTFIVRFRQKNSYPITARRGSLYGENLSAPAIDQTLKFIEENTAVGDFIGIMPEGNDLAFLTGRRIDLRHQVLIPGFLSENDELDAIDALERDNVRYIFVPNRAMREFGKVEFGRDFYKTLGDWIELNYRVVKVFGIRENEIPETGTPPFWIKVYERKQ